MKKLLLSSTFLVIASAAATAADLRLPAKASIAAVPAFSWTGCYVGAHVGGTNISTSIATNFEGTGRTADDNGTGVIAGGQLGCNYQQGNWMFGVEGEGAWSNGKATNSPAFSAAASETLATKNTNEFSIAGRAGIAVDRTLIYAKGGWAWGSFDFNSTFICCALGIQVLSERSGSSSLNGFLVGAGIEHALTRNWTIKFEYNYVDFGSRLLASHVTPGGNPVDVSRSLIRQTFKVGANYLFDLGGPPLVAKY